jgi:hypothetical protein
MKILIAGDSFAFGQGCSDRQDGLPVWKDSDGPSNFCWASLLQQTYSNLTVVNTALPGLDNTSILIKILDACIDTRFDLIVFAGSYVERKQIAAPFNPSNVIPWVPNWRIPGPDEYQTAQKYHLQYLSNIEIDKNISTSNILAGYGQASIIGAKFLWSLPEYAPEDNITFGLLDLIKSYQIKNVQNFDYSGNNDLKFNQQYECHDSHINNIGHRLYFEKQIVPLFKELKIIT